MSLLTPRLLLNMESVGLLGNIGGGGGKERTKEKKERKKREKKEGGKEVFLYFYSITLLTPFPSSPKKKIGPFQRIGKNDSYRDVQMLGKCDDSVENMCEKLGWGGEGRGESEEGGE